MLGWNLEDWFVVTISFFRLQCKAIQLWIRGLYFYGCNGAVFCEENDGK